MSYYMVISWCSVAYLVWRCAPWFPHSCPAPDFLCMLLVEFVI